MGEYNQNMDEQIKVEELEGMSKVQAVECIADQFAAISQHYQPIVLRRLPNMQYPKSPLTNQVKVIEKAH